MRTVMFTSLVCAITATATMAQQPLPAPAPPAATPSPQTEENAPLPGVPSFSEEQARSRLEANGYSDVDNLTMDAEGVWKASATHAGAKVEVLLDYRGNIIRH